MQNCGFIEYIEAFLFDYLIINHEKFGQIVRFVFTKVFTKIYNKKGQAW